MLKTSTELRESEPLELRAIEEAPRIGVAFLARGFLELAARLQALRQFLSEFSRGHSAPPLHYFQKLP